MGAHRTGAGVTGLRVASFPTVHPYIAAVRPDGVVPVGPPPEGWAPHPWWDPSALAAHAHEVDVLHVHFGYDHLSPGQLQAWTARVGELGIPLVVTVHDLRNPHHPSPDRHDGHLATLLPAGLVLTLTAGAADEIAARFGVTARVVAHPGLLGPPPARVRPRVAGLHLKSLRLNLIDPDAVVAAASAGARDAGSTLRVDVHTDTGANPRLASTRALGARGEIDLRVGPRLSDPGFATYLASLHASVLPHRFGTHSGWLEACRDLGTRVVAPDCGYYAEQWAEVHGYGNSEARGLDATSLRRAVAAALRADPVGPADPEWRAAQRATVRRAHAEVYGAAVRGA